MIYLFTDFGYRGPYIGEMRAILKRKLTHQQTTDLMHDVPAFNPRAGAYLLAALSRQFVYGDICLAVVDPGVGNPDRKPLIVEVDGVNYIGPDNGLLSQVIRHGSQVQSRVITWQPEHLSSSFHGRDLFAPVAVKVALRERLETEEIAQDELNGSDWTDDLHEVIYIDRYGNTITGIDGSRLSSGDNLSAGGQVIAHAETFSRVSQGESFWYTNSMGLVEIAVNQGSAADKLKLTIGSQCVVNRE